MKIYAVGDIHGYWPLLNPFLNKKKPDIVFQCGDFGYWPKFDSTDIISDNPIRRNQKPWNLFGIKAPNTTIYFCDGNHEDHWELKKFGNKVSVIYDKIYYMPRGSILELPDGRNVLFIGGADSIDKYYRTIGYDWFPEEVINFKDFDRVIRSIKYIQKIDIVISHTAPTEFFNELKKKFVISNKLIDPSCEALSQILEIVKPDLWYFGHFHESTEGIYKNTKWFCLNQVNESGWYKEIK